MDLLDASIDRSLMVDENDIDRLSRKLIVLSFGSISDDQVSKQQLRFFTEKVLNKTCPNRKFNEESFNKGYKTLDPDNTGFVAFEKVRGMVESHFVSIGLHLWFK